MQHEEIQVEDIEAALKKLWDQDREQKKTRASLFNLIFYSEEKAQRTYFKTMIQNIIEKFPCRVIFIEYSPNGPATVEAAVTSESTHSGEAFFACDEINLSVGRGCLERVPFIISRHLLPDLPIYLFWGCDPADPSTILQQLKQLATRLIFICNNVENLSPYSYKLLDEIDNSSCEVMDINWALISGWRDILAQIFASPSKFQLLKECEVLEIAYTKEAQSTMQAIYLQGWLAARLGWKIKGSEKCKSFSYMKPDGKKAAVTLLPESRESGVSGTISSITVRGPDGCLCELIAQPRTGKVVVKITTQDRCLLPYSVTLPSLKRGFNFIKEIFYEPAGSHYVNMLHTLATIPWKH